MNAETDEGVIAETSLERREDATNVAKKVTNKEIVEDQEAVAIPGQGHTPAAGRHLEIDEDIRKVARKIKDIGIQGVEAGAKSIVAIVDHLVDHRVEPPLSIKAVKKGADHDHSLKLHLLRGHDHIPTQKKK
jgi:hypothetical protein